jgi:nucleotide-binding universal stress UspA family protein
MFKHILLPTDGSDLSDKGVKQTIRMAKSIGASITAVHIVRSYHAPREEGFFMPDVAVLRDKFKEEAAKQAREILNPVKQAADKAGVKCNTVIATADSPYRAIITQAKKSKCDLIMMASHGRRGIQRLLHGSEAANVLTHSRIPVLVLR